MQGRPFLKGELEMLLQARELQRVAKEQALRSSRSAQQNRLGRWDLQCRVCLGRSLLNFMSPALRSVSLAVVLACRMETLLEKTPRGSVHTSSIRN